MRDKFEYILKNKLRDEQITPPPFMMDRVERHLADVALESKSYVRLWSRILVAASVVVAIILLGLRSNLDEELIAQSDAEIISAIESLNTPKQEAEILLTLEEEVEELPSVVVAKNNIIALFDDAVKPEVMVVKIIDDFNHKDSILGEEIKPYIEDQKVQNVYNKPIKKRFTENPYAVKLKKQSRAMAVQLSTNSLSFGSESTGSIGGGTSAMSLSTIESMASNIARISSGEVGIELPENIKHKMPISIGAHIDFSLSDRWSIETGLIYTLLNSDAEVVIHDGRNGGESRYLFEQKLHYIGVPIAMRYKFLNKSYMGVYAKSGAVLEYLVSGERSLVSMDKKIESSLSSNGVQASVNIALGVEVKLIPDLGLYVEPGLSYYFDMGEPANYRTDRALSFNLSAGLRFMIK